MKISYLPIALLLIIIVTIPTLYAKKVAIIGCGYVGLTMAAVISQGDHHVTCIDINEEKIKQLTKKTVPLYEPQLDYFLFESIHSNNITFSSNIKSALDAEILFICTPTPTNDNGRCDCSFLQTAFNSIIQQLNGHDIKIICIKSTVPPGTIDMLNNQIPEEKKGNIHLVYNPEFMREGCAIHDVYYTNPIVLAGEPSVFEHIEELFSHFPHKNTIIKTDYKTAELIKYAWNSFSAMRIAYINELSILCRNYHADIQTVVKALGHSENLLPTETIKPGPGFGGSCLPKDTLSFSKIFEDFGYETSLVHQTIVSNKKHQEQLIHDVTHQIKQSKKQPTVTILGLSFKSHTNDIRNAPAIQIINSLLDKKINIHAYDKNANEEMKKIFPTIHYYRSPYEAIAGSDLIVILTDCPTIKNLDLDTIAQLCNKKKILDTRNVFSPSLLKEHGFDYINMGLA